MEHQQPPQPQGLPPPLAVAAAGGIAAGVAGATAPAGGFELEEALFSTAPVGLHCVDANGVVLWANRTELGFLGFESKDGYVGRYVSSFVYSDKAGAGSGNGILGGGGDQNASAQGQGQGGGDGSVNLITADDRTLYKEVLKRVVGGNPISEIPVRFVTRSGTVIHLLLDCDGSGIPQRNGGLHNNFLPGSGGNGYYYRFFTRDDTSRRIQEMRSNVLFQETNRSLQMLDNFMNRSMQQMRAPLTLMERACNVVTENIEDIDEVLRRNAASMVVLGQNSNGGNGFGGIGVAGNDDASVANSIAMRRSSSRLNMSLDGTVPGEEDGKPAALPSPSPPNNALQDCSAPLSVALSATMEARSVVGLASTLTKDALALVDDITDLCRFDQGRVLLIEKEAVKVREICLEALNKVPVPVGGHGPGAVDVSLDVREGAPGRTMADRSVLQRSLALLLNFAVDAAANAAAALAAASGGGGGNGTVILSVADAAEGQPPGTRSACRISVFYTNPPADAAAASSASAAGGANNGAAEASAATAFASSYTPIGNRDATANGSENGLTPGGMTIVRGDSHGRLLAMQQPGGGSMMRRTRLRESIQNGMTSCRRDKLGLGLSLLHHLVGAQGSDLRYEIVNEAPPLTQGGRGPHLPSMTKFWFLLPMSLDFPDRLPAERIVKQDTNQIQHNPQQLHQNNCQQQQQHHHQQSLLPSNFLMAPNDGGGLGNLHQQQQQQQQQHSYSPQRKRARTSSSVAMDRPNSILSSNIVGAAMGGDASLLASSAASSSPAATKPPATKPPATKPPPPIRQYPGVMPGARPLVLVVEDTDVSASLLCMHLRKLNCTSHRAENGEVAIEMLRSAPAPNMYALVLMDLRMPVMDGFAATEIIKGSNASNIPVVALTGETSEENRRRCEEIGFDDYKTKPLKRPQLKELLIKLVPGYTPVE